MNNASHITFCMGVGTVTGANFLLETPPSPSRPQGSKILIDCGLVQGEKVALKENREAFPYGLSTIDALIITHAHLDHVGRIPKLVKDGYQGPIYSTPQTRELAELVLNDAVNIIAGEARQDDLEPLYDLADVQAVFPLWKTIEYHAQMTITDDVSVFLKDAGHILGSSMVEVTVGDRTSAASVGSAGVDTKVLFTGDLGNSPAPLLCDTETPGDVDRIVMESVYGDRNHEEREERDARFQQIITDTVARGGTLVIPAFSIDRTQILLYELNNMVERKKIPSIPVFVDSPMAIRATQIYRANTRLFNEHVREQIEHGDDIFSFPHLQFTLSPNEAAGVDQVKGPKIILAGSGMSVGGRIIGHEEEYLPDERSTILLVGYQSAGSLGRELADGAKKVAIHGRQVEVKAHIESIFGYSAHKDGDHLVEFVASSGSGFAAGSDTGSPGGSSRLKKVFVVMGEPKASMHLAQRLNSELGVKATVPERGKRYEV